MKFFIVILLVTFVDVFATDRDEWTTFKDSYNKSYKNSEEETYRLSIFKRNLKEILEHNADYKKGLVTYTKQINKYADLTPSEFQKLYGLTKGDIIITYNDTISDVGKDYNNGSEFLDWREKGLVTSVKEQGACGACWIFSAIGVLEAHYFKKHGQLISLSAQHMIDCISNITCNGGWPEFVLSYVQKHGIITEDDYPYEAKHGQCREKDHEKVNFTFTSVEKDTHNETYLKELLDRIGPISICVYATKDWMFYDSGVWYEKECSEDFNHAVLLVGYGRENGSDYWLIKNSMGPDWGEGGYIKIARNKHHNYCGITSVAFYVVDNEDYESFNEIEELSFG